jgi:predicted transcriptional regulator
LTVLLLKIDEFLFYAVSMNKQDLLDQLISLYNLRKNHADILQVLFKKNLNADQILNKTSVSSGRIYRLLKELETMGLIEKKEGKPAKYSTHNFANKVRNFLQFSFNESISKQASMNSLLTSFDENIAAKMILGSKAKYDAQLAQMFKMAKWIKIVHKESSFPWFIYLQNKSQFIKIRGRIGNYRRIGSAAEKESLLFKRQAYLDLYQEKPVEQIMSQQAYNQYLAMLEDLFGEKGRQKFIKILLARFKDSPQVKIYVLKNIYNPFSTYISDSRVLQFFFFKKKQNKLLKMTGQPIVETYADYFEKYQHDAKDIRQLLQRYVK